MISGEPGIWKIRGWSAHALSHNNCHRSFQNPKLNSTYYPLRYVTHIWFHMRLSILKIIYSFTFLHNYSIEKVTYSDCAKIDFRFLWKYSFWGTMNSKSDFYKMFVCLLALVPLFWPNSHQRSILGQHKGGRDYFWKVWESTPVLVKKTLKSNLNFF